MVLLGWGKQKSGEAPLPANHCYYSSVNTSTTNAPIKNQSKGGDSLRGNTSSANRVKKLN